MAKFYEIIGRLFSRAQMKKLGSLLEASGTDMVPEAFAGFVVLVSALASLLAYLLVVAFEPLRSFVFRLSAFISLDLTAESVFFFAFITAVFSLLFAGGAIIMIAYVTLLLRADSRRQKVEEVLPDFLSLASANVRAGMTIDQAMWYAAKPEFGILSTEISIVAKKAFGGMPFNQAIDYLGDRFRSKSIRRAVALIKQGIASGGQLADILERTAEDARQMQILRKEIAASLLMYVIFVLFASVVGTPFLFAISSKLVGLLESVVSKFPDESALAGSGGMQLPLAMGSKPAISPSDFFFFTLLSSIITAIFSSLIIGVIYKGNKMDGVPYIPFMVAGALGVFYIVSTALGSLLSGIYV